jgi:hypothetical protein
MLKSGAFQKIVPSHKQELSSTTAPRRMTQIKCKSSLAVASSIICMNSSHVQLAWSKIMWNSVISTPVAKFGSTDIKNMYLETPFDQYKYMRMPLKLFLDDIIDHYNLWEKALNGYVYMEN